MTYPNLNRYVTITVTPTGNHQVTGKKDNLFFTSLHPRLIIRTEVSNRNETRLTRN